MTTGINELTPYELMIRLGQGRALETFVESLKEVATEVTETGKSGKVTLSIEIKSLAGPGTLEVGFNETIAQQPPKRGGRGTILFAHEGSLFTADPRQPDLGLTVVGETVVDKSTGEIISNIGDDEDHELRRAE